MAHDAPLADDHRDAGAAALDGAAIHLPSLLVAVAIMLVGSIYPPLFAGADSKADHGLATLGNVRCTSVSCITRPVAS